MNPSKLSCLLVLVLAASLPTAASRPHSRLGYCPELCGVAQSRALRPSQITVRFDYRGAEDLLKVFEKKTVSDSEIDELLKVRGVRAMVTNTIKYFPTNTLEGFYEAVREAAATGKQSKGDYQLDFVVHYKTQIRDLLTKLKAQEPEIVADIVRDITKYQPNSGRLPITIYFVAGGVSDGFVLDNDAEPAFFVALDKASGDFIGVKLNATHEAYHVAQKAATLKVKSLRPFINAPTTVPSLQRLLYTTLIEGTANYAADATKVSGRGSYIEMWRGRFERNLKPDRLASNFALFDDVMGQLQDGKIDWDKAYATGFFGGENDARFYFVGYEVARVLEKYEGRQVIGQAFRRPPADFFQRYIRLYRRHPEIRNRFLARTERLIMGR